MAKKSKLPKKVVGVRVPKFLRKSGLLKTLMASPAGRDLMAKAVVASAGAAAAILVKEPEQVAKVAGRGAKKSRKAAALATDAVKGAAHAAFEVLSDAAKSILPATKKSAPKKNRAQPVH